MQAQRPSPSEPPRPTLETAGTGALEPGGERPPAGGPWGIVRRHPVIASVMLVCTALGVVLGYALLTPDWSLARRLLAGAFAGAGTGLLITATKMF